MPETPLQIDTELDGSTARVVLVGELDLDAADAVTEALDGIGDRDATSVVVDVSRVSFLDSSGLRALLQAREKLAAEHVDLRLAGITGSVARVLDITGTRSILSPE